MASYPAPTETLPIFAPAVFDTNDIPLTIEEGSKYFITYPTAQGTITIPTLNTGTLNVSGVLTSTNNTTNIGLGYQALSSNTTGTANTAFGYQSGKVNDTGIRNTFIGNQSGLLTSGSRNQITMVGSGAGANAASLGSNSTGVGYQALYSSTGINNTSIGSGAGLSITTGTNNTCIGYGADITGALIDSSTAIGAGAVASTNNTIVLGTINETIRYQKVSPLYSSAVPSYNSSNIGWVSSGSLSYSASTITLATISSLPIGTYIANFGVQATATTVASIYFALGGSIKFVYNAVAGGTAGTFVWTGGATIVNNAVQDFTIQTAGVATGFTTTTNGFYTLVRVA